MEGLILQKVLDCVNANKAVALITLTSTGGSTPRDAGSIMAVFQDGSSIGSIGGGKLEYIVLKEAIEALKNGESKKFSHQLAPNGDLKMQCGGVAEGFIKIFNSKNRLIIAGGGHVGTKVLELGKFLGFYCVVVEDREDFKDKEDLQIADEIVISKYEDAINKIKIDSNTYIVVVTKDHLGDVDFVKEVLDQKFAYLGVIGSLKKQKSVEKQLLDFGFNIEKIKKIHSPIGLKISNQNPEEIALSIMAEILLIKNGGKLEHMKN